MSSTSYPARPIAGTAKPAVAPAPNRRPIPAGQVEQHEQLDTLHSRPNVGDVKDRWLAYADHLGLDLDGTKEDLIARVEQHEAEQDA